MLSPQLPLILMPKYPEYPPLFQSDSSIGPKWPYMMSSCLIVSLSLANYSASVLLAMSSAVPMDPGLTSELHPRSATKLRLFRSRCSGVSCTDGTPTVSTAGVNCPLSFLLRSLISALCKVSWFYLRTVFPLLYRSLSPLPLFRFPLLITAPEPLAMDLLNER